MVRLEFALFRVYSACPGKGFFLYLKGLRRMSESRDKAIRFAKSGFDR